MKPAHKVLVVDDDAVVGRSFDRVLSDKGYDVSTALDGEEGLSKCTSDNYDVVFTDIKMPGMDGIEVARRIKARCPWTPVVIITGYGTEENEAEARVLGVNGFVRKPLTPAMIEGITLKALKDREIKYVALPQTIEAATAQPEAAPGPAAAKPGRLTARRIIAGAGRAGLFAGAPLIGLAYALFLPFFGLALIAWLGTRAFFGYRVPGRLLGYSKNAALFFAAPFIGLGYAVLLPFVGFGILAWVAVHSLRRRPETQ